MFAGLKAFLAGLVGASDVRKDDGSRTEAAQRASGQLARYFDRNGRVRARGYYALPPFRPQGGSIPGSWDTELDGRAPLYASAAGEVADYQAEQKRMRRARRTQDIDLRIDRHAKGLDLHLAAES